MTTDELFKLYKNSKLNSTVKIKKKIERVTFKCGCCSAKPKSVDTGEWLKNNALCYKKKKKDIVDLTLQIQDLRNKENLKFVSTQKKISKDRKILLEEYQTSDLAVGRTLKEFLDLKKLIEE